MWGQCGRILFTSIHTNGQNGISYLSTLGGGLNSKYRCDIGYVVTPSITVGTYFAYSNIQVNQFDTIGNSGFLNLSYGKYSFFYGLSVKYQLLPLIFKTDKLRFQLYATTQLGLVSSHYYEYPDFYTKQRIQNPIFMEYGIGLGLGYKFSKHWGIFAEYNYGHFFNDNSSHLRGGLMVRL